MNTFLVLLIAILSAVANGCEPPDCDRPDYGTCGNACCRMTYHFATVPVDKLFADMQGLFDGKNGPDGRYTPQPMAHGGLGWADLTPYNLSVSYIGQVWHTTKTEHYNDTVDMTIAENEKGKGSTLNIFSISQIGGAYGDAGQNYKNIVQLVKALDHHYTEVNVAGCPKDQ